MHGANRLASNSLLEGLVVGGRAGKAAAAHAAAAGRAFARHPDVVTDSALNRVALQKVMTRDASVVRDADGLRRLADALSRGTVNRPLRRADLEDSALTLTARAVAAAALARDESRGCHHRLEYPDAALPARSTTVRLSDDGGTVGIDQLAAVG
jgi:L-aspartate oxidase